MPNPASDDGTSLQHQVGKIQTACAHHRNRLFLAFSSQKNYLLLKSFLSVDGRIIVLLYKIEAHPNLYPMDQFKRVVYCPRCKANMSRKSSDKCKICGTYIFNFCSSFFNEKAAECSYANPGKSRFCEMCGRPTYFSERGLLKPWQEVENLCYVAEKNGEYITI